MNYLVLALLFCVSLLSGEYIVYKNVDGNIVNLTAEEFSETYEIVNKYRFPLYVYDRSIPEQEKEALDNDEHGFLEHKLQELDDSLVIRHVPTTLYQLLVIRGFLQQYILQNVIFAQTDLSLALNDIWLYPEFVKLALYGSICDRSYLYTVIDYLSDNAIDIDLMLKGIIGEKSTFFQKTSKDYITDKYNLTTIHNLTGLDQPYSEDSEYFYEQWYPEKESTRRMIIDGFFDVKSKMYDKQLINTIYTINRWLVDLIRDNQIFDIDCAKSSWAACKILASKMQEYIPCKNIKFMFDASPRPVLNAINREMNNPNDYFMYRGNNQMLDYPENETTQCSISFGTMFGGFFYDRATWIDDFHKKGGTPYDRHNDIFFHKINRRGAIAFEFIYTSFWGYMLHIDKKDYRKRCASNHRILFIPPYSEAIQLIVGKGEMFHTRSCWDCNKLVFSEVEGLAINDYSDFLIDFLYTSACSSEELRLNWNAYIRDHAYRIK